MSDSDKPTPPGDPIQPSQEAPASPPAGEESPAAAEGQPPVEQPTEQAPEQGAEEPAIPDRIARLRAAQEKRRPGQARTGPVPSLQHEVSEDFVPKIGNFDEEMERELQEAMGGLSDQELYGDLSARQRRDHETPPGPRKGKVYRVHGSDVFIDLPGGRTQGVLPAEHFPEGVPPLGSEVEVHIEGFDRANGVLLLSRKGAAVEADWSTVAVGMTVEARVTGTNKGGLSVDVNGIRGFMPISQIDLYRVENPEEYLNQKLLCLVAEVNPEERNLVVSRRGLLEQQRKEKQDKLWQELQEGQVREGVVRTLKDFGAFVDLDGVDGLLHISEMSWTRIKHPSEVVQPGQRVRVIVTRIDPERRKISLGLKQLSESPWDDVESKYPIGCVVTGTVTQLRDFGAFVELEPAIEGLVHISELAPHRVWRVSDVVQPGQQVQVKVLQVDKNQRRISLSLKEALPEEAPPAPSEEAEEEEATPPPRPRVFKTPLRGGIGEGGKLFPDLGSGGQSNQ